MSLSLLENSVLQEVFFFQTLPQFSKRNNGLDTAGTNIDGFFGEIHLFPQLR
jgi:hypothetical protein